jgi:hypothetical protein
MRLLAIPIAVVGVSACSAPASMAWQKAGADDQTINRDASTCRALALGEAAQRYPYELGPPSPFGVPSGQQRNDFSKSTYEAARFESCMHGLGYHHR